MNSLAGTAGDRQWRQCDPAGRDPSCGLCVWVTPGRL